MAKQIVVDFTVKTGAATREVEDLKKEIKGLNKEVENTNEQTEQGLKSVEKASETTAGGVRKVGTALKALGIGLILAAFAKFTEILNQNQKVVDAANITFEVLSIIFNDIIGTVIESISSFDNLKESVRGIWENIKTLLSPAFVRLQKLIKQTQLGFKLLFNKKDTEGIARLTNELKELDEKFVEVKQDQQDLIKGTKDYFKEVVSTSKAIVDLNKQAERAKVINQGLIEQYDIQAERLRQVRDEERKPIAERIAANNKLKEVLEEQAAVMKENAELSVRAAQIQFDRNKSEENFIALQEAKNELLAVEAQVTGFLSEQKANDLALDRELIELTNSKLEAEANLTIEQKRFNAEQIEDNLEKLEKQKQIDTEEQELQTARLQRIVDEATEGTQAKIDAQIALDEFMEQSRQQNITRDKEIQVEEELILKSRKQAQLGFASAVGGVMSALGGLLQEGTAASKAAALADIVISTGVGFAQGLDIAQKTAKATGPAAAFAFPIFYATQIAAVISAVSKAKQILSQVKGGGGSSGAVSSGGGGGSFTPQAPSFNIVGSDPQNQLAQTISQQTQKPVKAFVVSGDVTTAQSLDRNIIQESSLG